MQYETIHLYTHASYYAYTKTVRKMTTEEQPKLDAQTLEHVLSYLEWIRERIVDDIERTWDEIDSGISYPDIDLVGLIKCNQYYCNNLEVLQKTIKGWITEQHEA